MPPTLSTVYSFTSSDQPPGPDLVVDAEGNVIVTTTGVGGGGSSILEIARQDPGYSDTPTTIGVITPVGGVSPTLSLIGQANGFLIGTSSTGGTDDDGSVFELYDSPTVFEGPSTLASFAGGADGATPYAPLVGDATGNLFGTTSQGGAYGFGTAFEIAKTDSGYGDVTTLASFSDAPGSSLTVDAAGNLFGTTASGGANNDGTIFEIPKSGATYGAINTLVTFDGTNGSGPNAGLTMDAAGDLFGTTSVSAASPTDFAAGSVFELVKSDSGYSAPVTIAGSSFFGPGNTPAGVIVDEAGNVFGVSPFGGSNGVGGVFEIPKTSAGYGAPTTVASFTDPGGDFPSTPLTVDAAGNIFGITDYGGANRDGMVFEVTDTGYVACYGRGTLILTARGEEPVELLAIGDALVTASGALRPIRWIGRRSYAGRFANGNRDVLPICFKAGSLAECVPHRDLWVSPKHAMSLDGVLIPAEHLVNGVSIIQAEAVDRVDYFHIELDSHDVILAEGALSETFLDDGSRGMFHNAHEFEALYPAAERLPSRYCAPRVEDGYLLEAVRRRLAEQAGLADAEDPYAGPLRGTLDIAGAWGVEGWAQDLDHPEGAVCLDILVDGLWRARTLAHRYRDDLRAAGIGSGTHSFRFTFDTPLSHGEDHVIEVRRSSDGAGLWCSPRRLVAERAAA